MAVLLHFLLCCFDYMISLLRKRHDMLLLQEIVESQFYRTVVVFLCLVKRRAPLHVMRVLLTVVVVINVALIAHVLYLFVFLLL